MKRKNSVVIGISCILLLSTAFADSMKKTVEAVYGDRTALKGKKIIVSGKVVKVNNGIMKRNFLHIQDGTGVEGTNDLIITSAQTADVGQKITIEGTVVLDTDFGFGYNYPLLVEKSTIKIDK